MPAGHAGATLTVRGLLALLDGVDPDLPVVGTVLGGGDTPSGDLAFEVTGCNVLGGPDDPTDPGDVAYVHLSCIA